MKYKIKKKNWLQYEVYKRRFFLHGRVFDFDQGTWAPLAATSRLKWQREWNLFVKEDCFGFVRVRGYKKLFSPNWPSVQQNTYGVATAHLCISGVQFILLPFLDFYVGTTTHFDA